MPRPRLELFLYPWELESMDEYSHSLPSGATIGKFWKRNLPIESPPSSALGRERSDFWCVGCYAWAEPDTSRRARPGDEIVHVIWFDVVLRSGPEPRYYHAPDWSNYGQWKGRTLA